jgi:hypothetical protein
MPWEVVKSAACPTGKPFAVVKIGETEPLGCHATRADALKQQAALYANEAKGLAEGQSMGYADPPVSVETKADWDSAYVNALPDSAFACIEGSGDSKKRTYPHHNSSGGLDLPHLRNALSRVAQDQTTSCGRDHLEAHARAEGLGDRKDGPMTLEAKSFSIKDLELSEEGEVKVAFAEIGKVDHDGDYTFPGAIPTKDLPISAYQHTSWPQRGGLLPVGRATIQEEGDLAVAKGRFFLDTTLGRDTYHVVKHMKDLQEWSYGFEVLKTAPPPTNVKAKRGLKSLDVHELSPVLKGAGLHTATLAIKSVDDEDEDIFAATEFLMSLKDGTPAMPFVEMSTRLLQAVSVFNSRVDAIRDLRLKEGRKISTARLALLNEHALALGKAHETLMQMIAETEPHKDEDPEAEAKARLLRMRGKLARGHAELASVAAGG